MDYTTGSWVQKDPIGYPDGANIYQIDGSDPISNVDPTGYNHGPIRPFPARPNFNGKGNRTIDRLNYLLSPQQQKCPKCLQEMQDLAAAIDNAVASQCWQPPADFGNLCSGVCGVVGNLRPIMGPKNGLQAWSDGAVFNQCGDWQKLLIAAVQPVVDRYGKESCVQIFTADASKPGLLFDSTHNWLEVTGSNGTAVLDPWPSGGAPAVNNVAASRWPDKYVRRVPLVRGPTKNDVIPGGQQPATQPSASPCCK